MMYEKCFCKTVDSTCFSPSQSLLFSSQGTCRFPLLWHFSHCRIFVHMTDSHIILSATRRQVNVAQSCLTLWPHGLYSPWNSPGQNTGVGSHSLLQGSSQPGDWTQVSCIAGSFFTSWDIREALEGKGHLHFQIICLCNSVRPITDTPKIHTDWPYEWMVCENFKFIPSDVLNNFGKITSLSELWFS